MNLEQDIKQLASNALKNKKAHQKLITELKKLKPFDVDELFHTQHEEVFAETDCLQCANCCKTTPPLLLNEDINRISKALNIPVKRMMVEYVVRDAEGDLVFNQTPCPFLGKDNYCTIYDVRPNACREYPHTNRKKMHHILDLTVTNAGICPAVVKILDNIQATLLSD
ncbi:MAG: YkgJ family cysteine cluster protein [Sphingobacteriales bacterium]|nr:YkgJ family cysteine cluster protein [Sphingobacteriales bacterium]